MLSKRFFKLIILGLIIAPLPLIGWKLKSGYFSAQQFLPATVYNVQYDFTIDNVEKEQAFHVRTYVPQTNTHQKISSIKLEGNNLNIQNDNLREGKQILWKTESALDSNYHITYSFEYVGKAMQYELDSSLSIQKETLPEPKGSSIFLFNV